MTRHGCHKALSMLKRILTATLLTLFCASTAWAGWVDATIVFGTGVVANGTNGAKRTGGLTWYGARSTATVSNGQGGRATVIETNLKRCVIALDPTDLTSDNDWTLYDICVLLDHASTAMWVYESGTLKYTGTYAAADVFSLEISAAGVITAHKNGGAAFYISAIAGDGVNYYVQTSLRDLYSTSDQIQRLEVPPHAGLTEHIETAFAGGTHSNTETVAGSVQLQAAQTAGNYTLEFDNGAGFDAWWGLYSDTVTSPTRYVLPLNGSTQDVAIGASTTLSPGTADFTLFCVARPTTAGAVQDFYYDRDLAGAAYFRFGTLTSGRLFAIARDNTSHNISLTADTGAVVTDSAWHTFFVIRSGTNLTTYNNNTQYETGSVAGYADINTHDATYPPHMGSVNGTGSWFTGDMGGCGLIVGTALSSAQRQAIVDRGLNSWSSVSAMETDLSLTAGYVKAYWPTDDNSNAASGVTDLSANANHGSTAGTPTWTTTALTSGLTKEVCFKASASCTAPDWLTIPSHGALLGVQDALAQKATLRWSFTVHGETLDSMQIDARTHMRVGPPVTTTGWVAANEPRPQQSMVLNTGDRGHILWEDGTNSHLAGLLLADLTTTITATPTCTADQASMGLGYSYDHYRRIFQVACANQETQFWLHRDESSVDTYFDPTKIVTAAEFCPGSGTLSDPILFGDGGPDFIEHIVVHKCSGGNEWLRDGAPGGVTADDLTVNGTVTHETTTVKVGSGAMRIATRSTSNYLSAADSDDLTPGELGIWGWFRIDDFSNYNFAFGKGVDVSPTSDASYEGFFNTGTGAQRGHFTNSTDSTGVPALNTAPSAATWTMHGWTFDGATVRHWMNNAEQTNTAALTGTLKNTTGNLEIGRRVGGATAGYQGYMDAIVGIDLTGYTTGEITTLNTGLYNSGSGVDCKDAAAAVKDIDDITFCYDFEGTNEILTFAEDTGAITAQQRVVLPDAQATSAVSATEIQGLGPGILVLDDTTSGNLDFWWHDNTTQKLAGLESVATGVDAKNILLLGGYVDREAIALYEMSGGVYGRTRGPTSTGTWSTGTPATEKLLVPAADYAADSWDGFVIDSGGETNAGDVGVLYLNTLATPKIDYVEWDRSANTVSTAVTELNEGSWPPVVESFGGDGVFGVVPNDTADTMTPFYRTWTQSPIRSDLLSLESYHSRGRGDWNCVGDAARSVCAYNLPDLTVGIAVIEGGAVGATHTLGSQKSNDQGHDPARIYKGPSGKLYVIWNTTGDAAYSSIWTEMEIWVSTDAISAGTFDATAWTEVTGWDTTNTFGNFPSLVLSVSGDQNWVIRCNEHTTRTTASFDCPTTGIVARDILIENYSGSTWTQYPFAQVTSPKLMWPGIALPGSEASGESAIHMAWTTNDSVDATLDDPFEYGYVTPKSGASSQWEAFCVDGTKVSSDLTTPDPVLVGDCADPDGSYLAGRSTTRLALFPTTDYPCVTYTDTTTATSKVRVTCWSGSAWASQNLGNGIAPGIKIVGSTVIVTYVGSDSPLGIKRRVSIDSGVTFGPEETIFVAATPQGIYKDYMMITPGHTSADMVIAEKTNWLGLDVYWSPIGLVSGWPCFNWPFNAPTRNECR